MTPPPDDSDFDDDKAPSSRRAEGAKSLLTDGLRKAIQSGANALFTSEEGGKKPLGELRLPKEAMQFIYQQAERGRKDLFRSARQEMRRMLSSMDMRGELRRALVGLKVQVKAEITITEADTELKVVEHTIGKATRRPAQGSPSIGDNDTTDSSDAQDAAGKKRRRPRPEV